MKVYCIFVLKENIEPTKFAKLKNSIVHFNRYQNLYCPLGILYIKSSLNKNGFITDINYYNNFTDKQLFMDKLNKFNPKLVALSITSEQEYNIAKNLILKIKENNPQIKIILGGAYPTLATEEVIENENIDAVCIGEGEIAVAEYARQVEKGEYKKTDNLYIRNNDGQIIKCDKSVLIEDIDSVPYPDIYSWKQLFKNKLEINYSVLLERGCKYRCIYCSHHALSKRLEGTYLRYRKIENVIEEIKYILDTYSDVPSIKFESDNILANIDYFKELCESLHKLLIEKNRKDLSFFALMNFTPNLLQDNCFIIDYLKKANIRTIAFGLESGSLEMRKRLHRPYYENEQFIEFCKKLKENNIKSFAFVMYCYPFETKETYKATIDCLLKSKIQGISYAWLTPYKGTLLYNETQKQYKDAPLIDKWRYLTFRIRLMPMFFYNVKDIIANFIKRNKKEQIENLNNKNINLAKQELDKGNYKQAVNYFNKVKIREDNYWVYGDRAIAKMEIKDYDGAIKDFDKVLSLDPKEIYKRKRLEAIHLKGN